MVRFSDVFLTSAEIKILNELSSFAVAQYHPTEVCNLIELGFVSRYALSNNENEYVILNAGLNYLEYNGMVEKDNRETKLHLRTATAIAILGLVIALFSLILQLLI